MKIWKLYRHDAEPGGGAGDPPPPPVETPPPEADPAPQDVAPETTPEPAPEPTPEPPDDGTEPDNRANSRLAKERDEWRIKFERSDAARAALDAKLTDTGKTKPSAETLEQKRARHDADPFLFGEEEARERRLSDRSGRAMDRVEATEQAKADPDFLKHFDEICNEFDLHTDNPERDCHFAMMVHKERHSKAPVSRGAAIAKAALKGGKPGGGGVPPVAGFPSEEEMARWLTEGPDGVEKYRQARRKMGIVDRL